MTQEEIESVHSYAHFSKIKMFTLGTCVMCGHNDVPLYSNEYVSSLRQLHDKALKQATYWAEKYDKEKAQLDALRAKIGDLL